MLSCCCCCSKSMCSWEPTGAHVSRLVDEAEHSATAAERSRMDVAQLREQYRWTKENQKCQTQVVLFRQAPDTAEEPSGGGALFRLVPVCRTGSLETQLSDDHVTLLPEDPRLAAPHPDRSPWSTDLGMHRRTCRVNVVTPSHPPIVGASPSTPSSSKPPSPSESCSRGSGRERAPSWASAASGSFEELDGGMTAKFSALSRQLSFGGLNHQQPPPASSSSPSSPHHYPFPRRKTQRKSETAQRLGMYSSF